MGEAFLVHQQVAPEPRESWQELVVQATSQEVSHQDDLTSGMFFTRLSGARPKRPVLPHYT